MSESAAVLIFLHVDYSLYFFQTIISLFCSEFGPDLRLGGGSLSKIRPASGAFGAFADSDPSTFGVGVSPDSDTTGTLWRSGWQCEHMKSLNTLVTAGNLFQDDLGLRFQRDQSVGSEDDDNRVRGCGRCVIQIFGQGTVRGLNRSGIISSVLENDAEAI
jgi:hypothetical protein